MELANQVTWSPGMTLEENEEMIIKKALQFYGNNKTKTAQALGIAIRTIDNKLEGYKKRDLDLEKQMIKKNEDEKKAYSNTLEMMKSGRKEGVTVFEEKKKEEK